MDKKLTLNSKLEKLKEILKNMGNMLIAYSGGVDSTLLLSVAKDVLGENVFAVTSRSGIHPEKEHKFAVKMAKKLKVKHLTITTDELYNPSFTANPVNRCYYCKKELFTKLQKIAATKNIKWISDGTNYDDRNDFRPGMLALKELSIRSPLKEARLTKEEIRHLSKRFKLPTWNKPPLACLVSRIPYGDKITIQKLKMINEAENYLCNLGMKQVRVRHHGDIARIEVLPIDIPKLILQKTREKILKKFKKLGYKYITLDLQGYRSGSMNEGIVVSQKPEI